MFLRYCIKFCSRYHLNSKKLYLDSLFITYTKKKNLLTHPKNSTNYMHDIMFPMILKKTTGVLEYLYNGSKSH